MSGALFWHNPTIKVLPFKVCFQNLLTPSFIPAQKKSSNAALAMAWAFSTARKPWFLWTWMVCWMWAGKGGRFRAGRLPGKVSEKEPEVISHLGNCFCEGWLSLFSPFRTLNIERISDLVGFTKIGSTLFFCPFVVFGIFLEVFTLLSSILENISNLWWINT